MACGRAGARTNAGGVRPARTRTRPQVNVKSHCDLLVRLRCCDDPPGPARRLELLRVHPAPVPFQLGSVRVSYWSDLVDHAEMRLLIVEDDMRLVRALARAGAGGVRGGRGRERRRGAGPGPGDRLRRRRARRDAARAWTASACAGSCASDGRWTPVLMLTARDGVRRPHPRPRRRRRRLPHQAVRLRRAPRPAAGSAASRAARAPRGDGDRGPEDRSRHARRDPRRPRCRAERTGVRRARVPRPPRRARWSRAPSCWITCGTDYDGSTNVVDVYVGYLRRKLETSGPLIRTVRGAGYVLDPG